MHEELFHSPERPFRATPDTRFYYPHESIETARQTIVRAMMRAEGPVMVIGGAGLGKSLLGLIVTEDLSARFDAVKLHAAKLCSRRALLQNILFELNLPYREMTEGDLRLSILARLEPSAKHAPEGVVIVVDEADTLPAKLLEELRLITNFTRNNQPRARLVLIGGMRLEHTFAEPQLESFNQRLAARCYLQPMNRQQTCDYVRHQLNIAGVSPREMITDDALATVYAASEGVPRLSNQIMDHALVLAITRSQCPVSSALIEEAWADLQQLPAPWHSGADKLAANKASAPIEFGSLDEAEDAPVDSREAIEVASVSGSFFSAFTPPDDDFSRGVCVMLGQVNEPESRVEEPPLAAASYSTDKYVFVEFEGPVLERPSVVFEDTHDPRTAGNAASIPMHLTGALDDVELLPVDSFFSDRPTDERLFAFDLEQREYDSMGVWESDPPLAAYSQSEEMPGASASSGVEAHVSSINLFGDDFEDETPIPDTGAVDKTPLVARFSRPTANFEVSPKSNPSEGPLGIEEQHTIEFVAKAVASFNEDRKHAVEAADYVARIQEYADALHAANARVPGGPLPTVDEVLAQSTQERAQEMNFTSIDTWSVDVASLDVEEEVAVQLEIEDLVSQLNFSAFSVEPFSLEQISLEPGDNRPRRTQDFVRNGANDEIYTLHRPQGLSEEAVFNGWTASDSAQYDDDRDLLVVEEDVPVSTKPTEASEQSITQMAPYSQLFAKLRK